MSLRLKVWGCRGSIPTPGEATVRFGGNTSCVEVRTGDGGLLMNLGCLVTAAQFRVPLYVLLIDNGLYEVTGGQPVAGAGRTDFDRNLVGCTADPSGLDLYERLHILDGCLEYLQRIDTGLFAHNVESTVTYSLCSGLFALFEQNAYKPGYQLAVIFRIRKDISFF